jgi:hypothetical protein
VVVSSLLPSLHFTVAAVIAGILATAVEFVKLYRTPAIDAFRLTFPGIVMLVLGHRRILISYPLRSCHRQARGVLHSFVEGHVELIFGELSNSVGR